MAYQTIRDLVAQVRSLHGRLQDAVLEAKGRTDDRSAVLLDFIGQHESALEQAVLAAEQISGKAVLDTWLQFEQSTEVTRAMKQRRSGAPQSGDEIVGYVLDTENSLIRLYGLLQGSTSAPSVQAFFASLLDMEDSAVRRSARAKLEAGDF